MQPSKVSLGWKGFDREDRKAYSQSASPDYLSYHLSKTEHSTRQFSQSAVTKTRFNSSAPIRTTAPDPWREKYFNSSSKFKEIPLPSVYNRLVPKRGVRIQPVYIERQVQFPSEETFDRVPQKSTNTVETIGKIGYDGADGQWSRLVRQDQALLFARARKLQTNNLPHREPCPYLLKGNSMMFRPRAHLEREGRMPIERLEIAPAPEIFAGQGMRDEASKVRKRGGIAKGRPSLHNSAADISLDVLTISPPSRQLLARVDVPNYVRELPATPVILESGELSNDAFTPLDIPLITTGWEGTVLAAT